MTSKRSTAETRTELSKGWKAGVLSKLYTGYDPAILTFNDKLSDELLYGAHLIEIYHEESTEQAEEQNRIPDIDSFVETMADLYTLDKSCAVCKIITKYQKKFPVTPEWMVDYSLLCFKSQSIPLCATSTFITAFEFIFIMDKHYLHSHSTSLVGAISRREFSLGDIQKHFFLNGCFKAVEGGLDSKIDLNNYSFLVQSVARYALLSTRYQEALRAKIAPVSGASADFNFQKSSGMAVALLKWREYARPLECFCSAQCMLKRKNTETASFAFRTCAQKAALEDISTESKYVEGGPSETLTTPSKWGFTDLTALLIAGTAGMPNRELDASCSDEPEYDDTNDNGENFVAPIIRTRNTVVENFHATLIQQVKNTRLPKTAKQYICDNTKPSLAIGPILASILPHPTSRGDTGGECVLCNLMLTREHWHALRKLKSKVVGCSNVNSSLFDGIEPALETFEDYTALNDGGRMLTLLRMAGANAIYKHFFCDPLCAVNTLRVNPKVLWEGQPKDPELLQLYKAEIATANIFQERVCRGLWILAFTFKAYQLSPPRPTALNSFIRGAETYLKRHGISCIALEHALTRYV
ncbi:DNA packaging protein UL32 [Gallid alphaherpesvirus 1]|nr:DNA packaging protein UL32 [Gallid alphaherpesvirus 1]WEG21210.1 DNA packaging protein UL32 [Gallid alphaherpesvirus 1]